MPPEQTMNSTRGRPQYLDLLLLRHPDNLASASVQAARRNWWLSIIILGGLYGLVLGLVVLAFLT